MTLDAVAYYTLLITPFLVHLAMLTLQVGAYRRDRHLSFLVLSVATMCGVIILISTFAIRWWSGSGMPVSSTWYVALASALLVQGVLTVWGTASLFQSYGALAAAVPQSVQPSGSRLKTAIAALISSVRAARANFASVLAVQSRVGDTGQSNAAPAAEATHRRIRRKKPHRRVW